MTKTRDLANLIADSKVGPTEIDTSGTYTLGGIAATGNLTVDVAGYVDIDADDGGVYFSDGGTTFGRIYNDSSNLRIKSQVSDKGIVFQGVDGGLTITALTLDMSNAGLASFNAQVRAPSQATSAPTFSFTNDTDTGISRPTTNALNFITGGSERVRLDASGNLGINATPTQKLHVGGNAIITGLTRLGNGTESSPSYQFVDDTNTGMYRSSSDVLGFSTGGTNRLTLNSTGATFAGTVAITSNTPVITFTESDQSNKQYQIGSFGAAFSIYDASASAFRVVVDTSGTVLIGKTSSSFSTVGQEFRTAGVTILGRDGGEPLTLNRITSDGGILSLRKDNATIGTIGSTSGSMYIEGNSATGKSGLTFFGSYIEPRDNGSPADNAIDLGATSNRFKDLHLSGTANSYRMKVSTASSGASADVSADELVVESNGNSGISILSGQSYNGSIYFGDAGVNYDGFITYGQGTRSMGFGTAAGTRMTLDSNGRLGIGTASPDNPLEVVGADSGIKISAGSSNRPMLRFECGSAEKLILSSNTTYGAIGDASDANRYMAFKNGNVGIGTTNPEYPLDVFKATGNLAKITTTDDNNGATNPLHIAYNASLRVDNAWSGAGPSAHGTKVAKIQLGTVTTSGYGAYGAIILDSHGTGYDTAEMSFATGSNSSSLMTERMRIDSSGKVGIGTTSPSDLVHLKGGSGNSSTGAPIIRLQKQSGGAVDDGQTIGGISFYVNDNGVNSGSSYERAKIIAESQNSSSGTRLEFWTGNSNADIAERMRIIADGNVGIGTTNVTEKLTVDGSFNATASIKSLGVYNNTTGTGANVAVDSAGGFARSTSSRRYKNTINDATHGLTELLKLRPVTYKGNNDGDTLFGGLIAEEVHDAGLTEFVTYNDKKEPDALAYGNMVSLCIKAIQELSKKNDALEARLTALEA